MSKHRSAMGKEIDMAALQAKNERVRAVGNMKVNARGDTIDATGKVIQSVTAKVNSSYTNTVGNRSAQVVRRDPSQNPAPRQGQRIEPIIPDEIFEMTDAERELEAEIEAEVEEVEIVKTKTKGSKK